MSCLVDELSRFRADKPGDVPSLIRLHSPQVEPWALSNPLSTQRRLVRLDAVIDTHADLTSLWAPSLCWFCHALAQM